MKDSSVWKYSSSIVFYDEGDLHNFSVFILNYSTFLKSLFHFFSNRFHTLDTSASFTELGNRFFKRFNISLCGTEEKMETVCKADRMSNNVVRSPTNGFIQRKGRNSSRTHALILLTYNC